MADGLPARLAVALQQRQPGRREGGLRRLCHPVRGAHRRRRLVRRQVEQGRRVALHRHQRMPRVELAEVEEGDRLRILEHHGRRNLAGNQAAEDALVGG